MRIEGYIDAAGVLVLEQDLGPGLAAVGGAEDAALLIRPVRMPKRSHENDAGIARVDDQLADRAGVAQAHVLPGFARVERFVDAVAGGGIAADAAFAGADIDDVGIGRRHGQAADGGRLLVVEDGLPGGGAIRGFPDAAAGGAEVVSGGIAGDARGGQGAAAAEWANRTVLHALFGLLFVLVVIVVLGFIGRGGLGQQKRRGCQAGEGERSNTGHRSMLQRVGGARFVSGVLRQAQGFWVSPHHIRPPRGEAL